MSIKEGILNTGAVIVVILIILTAGLGLYVEYTKDSLKAAPSCKCECVL